MWQATIRSGSGGAAVRLCGSGFRRRHARPCGDGPNDWRRCSGTTSTSSASSHAAARHLLVDSARRRWCAAAASRRGVSSASTRSCRAPSRRVGDKLRVEFPALQGQRPAAGAGARYEAPARNPRLLAHTISDEIFMQAAESEGRGADEARVHLRPQPRTADRHHRKARGEGALHLRLRRRERAAHHREP